MAHDASSSRIPESASGRVAVARIRRTNTRAAAPVWVVAMTMAGVFVAACSASTASQPPHEGSRGVTSTMLSSDPHSGGVDGTPDDRGGVVASLAGVEVEVSNAVAPFDHHSSVDNQLLELGLSRVRAGLVSDCLEAEGFPPIQLAPLPDRDDPFLMANWAFPWVEALARDGFPNLPGTPSSPDDSRQRSEAEAATLRSCAEEIDHSHHSVILAYELYASVRGPWNATLAEIDGTDEVRVLVDQFSACLQAEGIPADSATSELRFLTYVDSLLMATGIDESGWPEIRERMGKLYAECGRELFETRERLRGGERREAFLREHEVAIRELSELLYGGASP